jgi:hypothetical protein
MISRSSGSGVRSSGLEQVERSALNGESGQTGFCPAGVVFSGVPCGIEFRAGQPEQIDEFVAAVWQHASGSHGHDVSREHILAGMVLA